MDRANTLCFCAFEKNFVNMGLLQSLDNFSAQFERSLFARVPRYREEYPRNCVLEIEREDALEMEKGYVLGAWGRGWSEDL